MTRLILMMSGLFLFNSCELTDRFISPSKVAEGYFLSEKAGFSEEGLRFLSERKREQHKRMLENPITGRAFDLLSNLDLREDMTISNEVITNNSASVDVSFKAGIFEVKTTLKFVKENGWKIDSFGVLDL